MWIHISGHRYKFNYDFYVSLHMNLKMLELRSLKLKLHFLWPMMLYHRAEGFSGSLRCFFIITVCA
jgi:hypothetical protein